MADVLNQVRFDSIKMWERFAKMSEQKFIARNAVYIKYFDTSIIAKNDFLMKT